MQEIRLDQLLVDRSLVSSRTRGERLIKEHGVRVSGKLIKKPGKKFLADVQIELVQDPMAWVSRGALKLEAALDHWKIDPSGVIALDVGASTGGFTELLLSRGAGKVYAVDTGTGQLHRSVQEHPQVISFEQTDIRDCTEKQIDSKVDLCVIDVSFISLTLIFSSITHFLKGDATIIALYKPQFEVGKTFVGKHGIVKDIKRVEQVKEQLIRSAKLSGLSFVNSMPSPIKGGDGNQEYLLHFEKR